MKENNRRKTKKWKQRTEHQSTIVSTYIIIIKLYKNNNVTSFVARNETVDTKKATYASRRVMDIPITMYSQFVFFFDLNYYSANRSTAAT